MTTDEMIRECEWMLQYIKREWKGCEPHSRFARMLPAILESIINNLKQEK